MSSDRPLAIVTGGCHRLGGAIAGGLARGGWDLALHAHEHGAPDAALAATLRGEGCRWTVTTTDFGDPEAGARLVAAVAREWNRVPELLVNSAAAFGDDRPETATASDLMSRYAANCAAPARSIACLADLGRRAGDGRDRSVVNILDQRIVQPHGDQFSYTLSKIALAGLTEIAARELAPGLRVNAVAPGLTIPTDDYDAAMLARLADQMPLARLPAPQDVAAAVLYLAGATAVTAQTIFVDGGARLRSWRRDFMHVAEAADDND